MHGRVSNRSTTSNIEGDTRTAYNITKTFTSNKSNKSTVVKDNNGNFLKKEDEQFNRWAEPFTIPRWQAKQQLEMKRGHIIYEEVEDAVRQTRGNRAQGEERITGRKESS